MSKCTEIFNINYLISLPLDNLFIITYYLSNKDIINLCCTNSHFNNNINNNINFWYNKILLLYFENLTYVNSKLFFDNFYNNDNIFNIKKIYYQSNKLYNLNIDTNTITKKSDIIINSIFKIWNYYIYFIDTYYNVHYTPQPIINNDFTFDIINHIKAKSIYIGYYYDMISFIDLNNHYNSYFITNDSISYSNIIVDILISNIIYESILDTDHNIWIRGQFFDIYYEDFTNINIKAKYIQADTSLFCYIDLNDVLNYRYNNYITKISLIHRQIYSTLDNFKIKSFGKKENFPLEFHDNFPFLSYIITLSNDVYISKQHFQIKNSTNNNFLSFNDFLIDDLVKIPNIKATNVFVLSNTIIILDIYNNIWINQINQINQINDINEILTKNFILIPHIKALKVFYFNFNIYEIRIMIIDIYYNLWINQSNDTFTIINNIKVKDIILINNNIYFLGCSI